MVKEEFRMGAHNSAKGMRQTMWMSVREKEVSSR